MRVLEVIFTQTFTIRTTVLSGDDGGKLWIFIFDSYRVLQKYIITKQPDLLLSPMATGYLSS